MRQRPLSYHEYRQLKLREAWGDEEPTDEEPTADEEAGPTEDHEAFYLDPEEKPETDQLMAQYTQMQDELQNLKPQTPEYKEQLQQMTDVMDQLVAINPTDAVRGEEQRLRRMAGPADISQYPMYAAEQTMNDADPEDQQAHDDLVEIAGVYGLKLSGLKNPKTGEVKLSVSKKGLANNWTQTFDDYVSAVAWMKSNMNKLR